jgi:anti-anti-sigma factor
MGRNPFSLTKHDRDGTLLVTLAGELDMVGAEEVRAFNEKTLQRGLGHLLVDCARVTFIDSVGVRSLIHLAQRCTELGLDASFKLSADVQRVVDMMGIGSLEHLTSAGPER